MGGSGSGGYRWGHRRIPVEECLVLDINWLARQGAFAPSRGLPLRWGTLAQGAAAFNPDSNELVVVFQGFRIAFNQRLKVVSSVCRFGGLRYWFTCPQCYVRATKAYFPARTADLFLTHQKFACRWCWKLSYERRNAKNPYTIAVQRARRIGAKLGEMSEISSDFLGKPKRMRWTTYHHLLHRYLTERTHANQLLIADFAKRFPETMSEICAPTAGLIDRKLNAKKI